MVGSWAGAELQILRHASLLPTTSGLCGQMGRMLVPELWGSGALFMGERAACIWRWRDPPLLCSWRPIPVEDASGMLGLEKGRGVHAFMQT
mmetsp:Transcript_105699/g.178563  ORF Transcript_105699/g.178563 Transcript_105699/m.178563 type:complete len:91 (+) Transcript_105699:159-431(+)